MKKRLFASLLCLALCMGLLPGTARANGDGGVEYIERGWDGSAVTEQPKTIDTYTPIDENTVTWNGTTGVTSVTRGSGAAKFGEQYYNADDLFWLSRVIYTESGNQPLEGKMAVGNVVMNRVKHPSFPGTIEGVLAQKNQFTTYWSGHIARSTPNAESVIAAKLVLDGGVVEEVKNALYFDSAANSWASRNRTCVAVIGGHRFYA